jgi:hypothetical protein
MVGTYAVAGSGVPQGYLATPAAAPSSEKSTIHIDSPNSTSGALFGSYQLSGWAIDNTSGVGNVNILLDGGLMGTTTMTLARPDVCAAYPNQSGCPTVGWQYMLDTTRLADGSHTLETVAISNTGKRATTALSITVANAGQTASPLKLTIDAPTPQNPVSGQVTVSGWAEDPGSYVSSVGISFDVTVRSAPAFGVPSYATTGINRPDVCAASPGDMHCPNVGWSYTLNTSSLTNGPHTMTVVAYAANGDLAVATKTFTVANAGALKFYMDQPTASSGTLSGQTTVSGWAFDPHSHIASVVAVIDALTSINMNFGSARPDVCAGMPGGLDCPNVGWSGSLNTTQLANGTHTLSITATAQNGDSVNSQPISLVVNNPASGNTTHAFIDTPGAANQQFWGEATFSGWALDDATLLQRLDFLIDGNVVAAGGYSFTPRPDVCAAFPNRPNCPNVGWSYSVNTFALSNGTHTLTLRAVSSTNSQAAASANFTVNNGVGLNGTRVTIVSPAGGAAPLSAQTTASGWALSAYYYISSVSASIDAGPALSATYHVAAPDVCQAYPDAPDCPNIGWTLGLDTTQLANGVHRLNVTATPKNSGAGSLPETTQSVFFTVANSSAGSPIAGYIDTPTAATPTLSGVTSFSGWAIDQTAAIASISIAVDGVPFGIATYGGSRPDVCAGFPQYVGCPAGAVGWSFAIDTTPLVNGSHTLAVTSASIDGKYRTFASTFSTGN